MGVPPAYLGQTLIALHNNNPTDNRGKPPLALRILDVNVMLCEAGLVDVVIPLLDL